MSERLISTQDVAAAARLLKNINELEAEAEEMAKVTAVIVELGHGPKHSLVLSDVEAARYALIAKRLDAALGLVSRLPEGIDRRGLLAGLDTVRTKLLGKLKSVAA